MRQPATILMFNTPYLETVGTIIKMHYFATLQHAEHT